jgi:hypothetical protein
MNVVLHTTDVHKLNVLLSVHHSISVDCYQHNKLFIQFIDNQGPLHLSSITCSSSRGATQTAFGIQCAYNVSWLWHGYSFTVKLQPCHSQLTLYARNIPNAICAAQQVMLETCTGPWLSINRMKSESCWFHDTDDMCTLTWKQKTAQKCVLYCTNSTNLQHHKCTRNGILLLVIQLTTSTHYDCN